MWPVKVTSNTRRPSTPALGNLRLEVNCKIFTQLSINLYPLIFKSLLPTVMLLNKLHTSYCSQEFCKADVYLTNLQCLLLARCCFKHFPNMNSLSFHNNSVRVIKSSTTACSICRWGNWGTKRLSHLPRIVESKWGSDPDTLVRNPCLPWPTVLLYKSWDSVHVVGLQALPCLRQDAVPHLFRESSFQILP